MKKQQRSTNQKNEQSFEPQEVIHIGLKTNKLVNNFYNMQAHHIEQHIHLLINHNEDLFLYDSHKKKFISTIQHNIIAPFVNCAKSLKYRCLFLLDQNQTISVYSLDKLLLLASEIDLKNVRHCLDFMFLEESNCFLVLTPQVLKVVKVEISCNHLRSIFSSSFTFKMKQVQVFQLPKAYFHNFCNKIVDCQNFLLMSNIQDVKIIQKSNDKILSSLSNSSALKNRLTTQSSYSPKNNIILFKKLCEGSEQITCIHYKPEQMMLLCGSNIGDLKVYKINFRNILTTNTYDYTQGQVKVDAKNYILFKVSLHNTKPVLSLQMYSQNLILSVGADEYIQVISIDQMAAIQKFKTSSRQQNINFVENNQYVSIRTVGFDQHLYAYELSLGYDLVLNHNSQILRQTFYQNVSVMSMTDNSIILLKIQHKNNTKNNSKAISQKQSFVPPRCNSIKCIQILQESTQNQNHQFWVLTDQSEIYKYRLVKNSNNSENYQIIGILQLNNFTDRYGHQTKQKIVVFKFLDIAPVHFDSDIKQKSYPVNTNQPQKIKPIVLGCQNGQILISSSLTPTQIFCRLRYFATAVTSVQFCNASNTNNQRQQKQQKQQKLKKQDRLMLLSNSQQIVCVMLSNQYIPQTVYRSFIKNPLIRQIGNSCMAIVTSSTPKVIFPYKNNKMRIWIPSITLHETKIMCIQKCENKSAITGDVSGNIVQWNLHEQILLRIQVSQQVVIDACYCWKGVVMFGYVGKIFQIRKKEKKEEIQCKDDIDQKWIQEFTVNFGTDMSIQKMGETQKMFKIDRKRVTSQLFKNNKDNKQKSFEDIGGHSYDLKKSIAKISTERIKNDVDKLTLSNYDSLQKSNKNTKSNHKKWKSTIKYPIQEQRLTKIKSVLNQIQQSKDIRNTTISLIEKTQIDFPKINQSRNTQMQSTINTSRIKKSRNRQYQYLFHFPNSGLYNQLISKKMIQ